MLKILHTSDLHLGKNLYGKSRTDEFYQILDQLTEIIKKENIDVLLIAGDIFDSSMPALDAQKLYYDFLAKLAKTKLKHTVLIAGNHDSPNFLKVADPLLSSFNIHIVSSIDIENIDKEIIVLKEDNGIPFLIISAIPYLRERDIRRILIDENEDEIHAEYRKAVIGHIRKVSAKAFLKQEEILNNYHIKIPVIAMAHLFMIGDAISNTDTARDLFVGSLCPIEADAFDPRYDYIALGHLHTGHKIKQNEYIRYSGTPLPMNFGETETKHACLIEFDKDDKKLSLIPFSQTKKLVRIKGDLDIISRRLKELKKENIPFMVEILLEGQEDAITIKNRIDSLTSNSLIEILRIKDNRSFGKALSQDDEIKQLTDLNEDSVFLRLLESAGIEEKDRPEYISTYKEIRRLMIDEEADAK